MTKSKVFLGIALAVLAGFIIWSVVKNPPVLPEVQIQNALTALLEDSPTIKEMWPKVIADGYSVTFVAETLNGKQPGITIVKYKSAEIKLDLGKIRQTRDSLEAVLAHEIIHIHDARYKYGFSEFVFLVDRDKQLAWQQKEVEISAIKQEDVVRAELKATNKSKYSSMSLTRDIQNSRFK